MAVIHVLDKHTAELIAAGLDADGDLRCTGIDRVF